MSIYELHHGISLPEDPPVFDLRLVDRDIYGSSRVGTETVNQLIVRSDISLVNEFHYIQTVGDKRYELSNFPIAIGIGNVLEVVTDRKLQIETAPVSVLIDDGYTEVSDKSDSDIVVFYKDGKIVHSSVVTATGYLSNAGETVTKPHFTLQGAAGILTDVTIPGNVKFYKNDGNKTLNLSGGSPAGITTGVKIYTKAQVDAQFSPPTKPKVSGWAAGAAAAVGAAAAGR